MPGCALRASFDALADRLAPVFQTDEWAVRAPARVEQVIPKVRALADGWGA
ncbi:hypothetical protein M2317_000152 [Microbacterium sp. ZKA21]